MKKICRNCHFLNKTVRSDKGDTHVLSWNTDDRATGQIKNHYSASCYLGVWDTGIDPSLNKNLTEIIDKDRKDICFFMENRPGMSFQAAKILQKRNSQNAQLKKSNLYTQIGLWIAALALLANVIVTIFKKAT